MSLQGGAKGFDADGIIKKEMDKTEALICIVAGDSPANGKVVTKLAVKKGWTWKDCIRPVLPEDQKALDSCQKEHFGLCTKGRLVVTMDDGSVITANAGDAYYFPKGHNAVAEEDSEAFEFADTWAKETK